MRKPTCDAGVAYNIPLRAISRFHQKCAKQGRCQHRRIPIQESKSKAHGMSKPRFLSWQRMTFAQVRVALWMCHTSYFEHLADWDVLCFLRRLLQIGQMGYIDKGIHSDRVHVMLPGLFSCFGIKVPWSSVPQGWQLILHQKSSAGTCTILLMLFFLLEIFVLQNSFLTSHWVVALVWAPPP